jgi:hypothetical protein
MRQALRAKQHFYIKLEQIALLMTGTETDKLYKRVFR